MVSWKLLLYRIPVSRALIDRHFGFETASKSVLLGLHVESRLQIHPKELSCPKEAREAKRCICTDRSLPVDDLIDSASWYADLLSETVLTDPHGLQILLQENLARMYRWEFLCAHEFLLVVVDDLDLVRISALPDEADSPLVVNSDAVLPRAIPRKLFKEVAWG